MTTPITFTTNIEDRGALAFLKQLGDAISAIKSPQGVGPDLERAAAATKQALSGARDQLQAAKDTLFTTRQNADVANEAAAQNVRNARLNVDAAREQGRVAVAAAKEAGAAQIEAAQAGLAATRERAAASIALAKDEGIAARAAAAARVEGEQEALRLSLSQLEFEKEQLLVIKEITAEGVRGAAARVAGAREALLQEQNSLRSLRFNVAQQAINGPVSEDQQLLNRQAILDQQRTVQERRLILQDAQAALASTKELEASEIALAEARVAEGASAVEASKAAVSGAIEATQAVREQTAASVTAAKERAAADIAAAEESAAAAKSAALSGVAAARGAAIGGVRTAVGGVVESEAEANATRLAGNEAIRAASAQIQLEQANLRNARSAATAAAEELKLAESEAVASSAADGQSRAITGLSSGWTQILEVIAAIEAAKLFNDFIRAGTEFNQTIETATLGIASLITAEGKLTDAQGNVVTGARALDAAMVLSTDQVNKLRIAGLETAATTVQLVDAFQQAVAAGLSAGLNLDQIRQVTVQIVQAATAIGVPLNQLNQEVRSILQGTIDRNSRVAKVLLITNEEVRQAKEQGTLQDLLNAKLQAFTVAGERAAQTMQVLKSNLAEAFQVFAGTSTQPFFDQIKAAGLKALTGVFDIPNARIAQSFQGIVQAFQSGFGGLGHILADAINASVEGAARLSAFLSENHAEVVVLSEAFFDMARQIFGIVGDIAGIVVDTVKWAIQSGTLRATFQLIADTIKIVRENTLAVAATIGVITIALIGAQDAAKGLGVILTVISKVNPWLIAITALAALGIEIERVIHARDRELQQLQDQRTSYGQNTASAIALAREYQNITDKLNAHKLSAQEAALAQQRLLDITDQLNKLGVKEADVTARANNEHVSITQAINEEITARLNLLRAVAASEVDSLSKAEEARTEFLNASLKNGLIGQKIFDQLKADPTSDVSGGKVFAVFKQQLDSLNEKVNAAHRNLETIQPAIAAVEKELNKPLDPKLTADTNNDDDKKKAQELAEARKQARAALEEAKAQFDAEDAGLKTRLAEHQTSFGQYFADLASLQDEMFAKEVAAQEKLIRAANLFGKPGDQAEAQAGLDKILTQQNQAREQNRRDAVKDQLKMERDVEQITIEQLKATGHEEEAALAELHRKYGEASKEFQAGLTSPNADERKVAEAGMRELDARFNTEATKIRIDALKKIVTDGENDLNTKINDIKDQQEAGAITEKTANDAILVLYQNRKAALVDLLNTYAAIHASSVAGSADELVSAQAMAFLTAQINHLEPALRKADLATHQLRESIKAAADNVLENFFENGIRNASSFADAMRSLALSVIDSINQIVSKLIAAKIVETLFSIGANGILPGSGATLDAQGVANAGVVLPQRADGGIVTFAEVAAMHQALRSQPKFAGGGFHGPVYGPSTPVDAIPIWVTGGEYVINPKKVQQYGKAYFDEINFGASLSEPRRRRTRYADGGVVEALSGLHATGTTHNFRGEIGLDPGLLWKHLDTPAGHRVFVNVARKNAKTLRGIVSQ